jgi:hypothetical protein
MGKSGYGELEYFIVPDAFESVVSVGSCGRRDRNTTDDW